MTSKKRERNGVEEAVSTLKEAIKKEVVAGIKEEKIGMEDALFLIAKEADTTVNMIVKRCGLKNIRRSAKDGTMKYSDLSTFADAAGISLSKFLTGKKLVTSKTK